MLPQDLEGTVLPAIEGDELDVTKLDKPAAEPEHIVLSTSPVTASESWNILQKFSFFGIIIGVVAIYLKMRGASSGTTEKFPV